MTLANPFNLLDLHVVRSLLTDGLRLNAGNLYAEPYHPFQVAMQSLALQHTWHTVIHRAADTSALVQLRIREGAIPQAWLQWLAPDPAAHMLSNASHDTQLQVLCSAAEVAGQLGCHYVLAELAEEHAATDLLRRAGFHPMTRQVCLQPSNSVATTIAPSKNWHTVEVPSWVEVNHLYLHTVPTLLQRIELPPTAEQVPRHWAWQAADGSGRLLGFAMVRTGGLGTFVKPNIADGAQVQLAAMLAHTCQHERAPQPITVCVRQYQNGLIEPLLDAGWVVCGTQVLWAKRLVVSSEPLKYTQPIPATLASPPVVNATQQFMLY